MKYDRSQLKATHLTDDDLKAILAEFEAKYGMDSKTFYTKYNRCELVERDDDDYLLWAAYYDMQARSALKRASAGV